MLFRPLIADWAQNILGPSVDPKLLLASISAPAEAGVAHATLPCFRFAAAFKKRPDELAAEWATALSRKLPDWVVRVDSQKAYVNFHFHPDAYTRLVLKTIHADAQYGSAWVKKEWTKAPVAVEFSSPNMAKPIGIHHIRSTVIGNSIAKLFEFAGATVHRMNYIGDYGTNFGQLCYAFRQWGSAKELEAKGITHLLEIYVKFNQEVEKNPELQEESRKWFSRLENSDAEALQLWALFRSVSEREFAKIYALMGVRFTETSGEAHYAKQVEGALKKVIAKVPIEESEGAQVIFLEGFKTPLMIRKKDGSTLYSTRDIAAALDRIERLQPKVMCYVVAVQQKLHFEQLFALLEKMEAAPNTSLEHIQFGMLRFKEGTMSTRQGKIIFLDDVLDQAKSKAREIVLEKNPECPNQNEVAEAVGIGSIIFNDLKSKRERDVEFSWETALNFEGDSGPYVQYTHARTHALFNRNGKPRWSALPKEACFEEHAFHLAWTLSLFPEVIARAIEDREPYHVSQFLLSLCAAFNAYYANIKIRDLAPETKEGQLQLVDCAQKVLQTGLDLLGLRAPEAI